MTPQPKGDKMPDLDDLIARRDKLIRQRAQTADSTILPDRAAAHSTRVSKRHGARIDRALARYADLDDKIRALDWQIQLRQARADRSPKAEPQLPEGIRPGDRAR